MPWYVPVLTAVIGLFTTTSQKAIEEAKAKQKQAELEMQLAKAEEAKKEQQETLKKYALYGGGALLGLLVLAKLLD